ncbi:aryl-alcohol oxidase-like protein [Punctularia strigosozonata HHB-11173 SS5]|uniref:aryl-alcohol oxidase-like protein n=1 Tax=Punctularia strigosozonata (strain HHB-11173) TaxID=741275 RepID=UPI00044165C9|nr:aryl-alcohol oxidase-like protein [Punctularia strigosozonata HHB-11173 SS5]EIN11653.1 aryl-alcohol oxidase-like protein [Punctularia strigosozonata HHB-11173 SS5]
MGHVRLSEDPRISVLVLEAGASNTGVLDSEVPLLAARLWGTQYDWNYTTVPQPGLNGRQIPYARGKLLGGSSSINLMVYTRGSDDDWNKYAELTQDEGWNWNNVQTYFLRNEGFMAPRPTKYDPRYNPRVHSYSGRVSVSLPEFLWPQVTHVQETLNYLPVEYPFKLDYNDGNPLGVGWVQATIDNGERSSSATAYLPKEVLLRRNLHIVLRAQVTKIQSRSSDNPPRFDAVEFASNDIDTRHISIASKEVILAAGTFNTPQLLLLSGVGDPVTLSNLNITPVIDLPDVGQHVSDQPLVALPWTVNTNLTFAKFLDNQTNFDAALAEWNASRTGPFAFSGSTQVAWLRVADRDPIFANAPDPSSGPHSAHYEFLFSSGFTANPPGPGNFFTINTALISPTSRGTITINSSDPFHPPVIDPGLLASEFDAQIMLRAIKSARRFVEATPAWDGYIISEFGAFKNASNDVEIIAYARANARTIWHAVGSCRMTARDAVSGCVDPDLKVKGAQGLRIIDGSVLPFIPSAHTQVPIYIIAERGSDLIKNEWGLS